MASSKFSKIIAAAQVLHDNVMNISEKNKIKLINKVIDMIKNNINIKIYGGYAQNLLILKRIIIKHFIDLYNNNTLPDFTKMWKITDLQSLMHKLTQIMSNIEYHYNNEFRNYVMQNIDLSDCFYDFDIRKNGIKTKSFHDLDIYCEAPLQLAFNIWKMCIMEGYKNARIVEAIHYGTYSVKINDFNLCDITYIPAFYVKSLPYETIDQLFVAGDKWIMIDYYKMFSDTLNSAFRWEEFYENRFKKFIKYCNYPKINKFIEIKEEVSENLLDEYVKEYNTVILTGFSVFNKFFNNIKDNGNATIKNINIPYHELISVDYKLDKMKLEVYLYSKFGKIKSVEHQRFCYFFGNFTEYFVDDKKICILYDNNNIGIPYKILNDIKITSITYSIYHFMSSLMYDRLHCGSKNKETYYIIISQLLELQHIYYLENNVDEYDDTLFSVFTLDILGKPITSGEYKMTFKGYTFFKLDSKLLNETTEEKIKAWSYVNLSGNVIKV
jgi:hypothetical protein